MATIVITILSLLGHPAQLAAICGRRASWRLKGSPARLRPATGVAWFRFGIQGLGLRVWDLGFIG